MNKNKQESLFSSEQKQQQSFSDEQKQARIV